MEMLSTFTAVLHVANLSTVEHLVAVLEETDAFSKSQIQTVARKIGSRRYTWLENCLIVTLNHLIKMISNKKFSRLFIGIKKLLGMIDMAKQIDEERRVIEFLSQMESEGFLEMGA